MIFTRYGIGSEISINNFSFPFRLSLEKTDDKLFQKIQKELFLGHYWPFWPNFAQKWIFLEKKGSASF